MNAYKPRIADLKYATMASAAWAWRQLLTTLQMTGHVWQLRQDPSGSTPALPTAAVAELSSGMSRSCWFDRHLGHFPCLALDGHGARQLELKALQALPDHQTIVNQARVAFAMVASCPTFAVASSGVASCPTLHTLTLAAAWHRMNSRHCARWQLPRYRKWRCAVLLLTNATAHEPTSLASVHQHNFIHCSQIQWQYIHFMSVL